jgi:hypothetical protein
MFRERASRGVGVRVGVEPRPRNPEKKARVYLIPCRSASCKSPTVFTFGGEQRSMGNACSSRTRTYRGRRLCKLNHKNAVVQLPHAFLIPSLGSKSPPLQRDWQDPARTHQDNARAPSLRTTQSRYAQVSSFPCTQVLGSPLCCCIIRI